VLTRVDVVEEASQDTEAGKRVASKHTPNGTSIESVLARTVSVPLDNPTSFSTRSVTARDYTLVRVLGEDGVEGIGFCYAGSTGGELVTTAVRELLAPLLVRQDPYRVEGLWQKMYQEALLHGRAGSVMRAISALDIALWDRNARAANLPLYKYLGAFYEDTVPAYASGGYYGEGDPLETLGEEMAHYVDMGFKAVKMKVGRLDSRSEEKRVAAARDAVGAEVLLMLDANNAWADLPTALRFMNRIEKYDPYWIEEPFSPDDIDNHARLAERTSVLVATGEIEAGRWRHKELLEKHAAAILQTDAAVCGGISEFRRIAATADSYGVTLAPHWFHDLHVHLVAAAPNGRFVEYFPDDQVLNFRRLIDRQLEVRHGELALPTSPGLGFNFHEETVAKFSQEGWQ
jgi:L-alanine-DL-glutamate epimerase-like enolase superfamily enzyme